MTYGELHKEFYKETKIPQEFVEDYRPCCPPFHSEYIPNAIYVWLKSGARIIYVSKESKGEKT